MINSCYPLMAYGEVIGILHVEIPPSFWNEREQKIHHSFEVSLQMFIEQICLSLSNIELHQKLSHMAIHDNLTGLNNRHYLNETIERELYRAKRKDTRFGVIMMDLDRFKEMNDTYGHTAGDTVLAEVGSFIRSFFRIDDFTCRYGGKSFWCCSQI